MADAITNLLSPFLASAMPALKPQVEELTDVAYARFRTKFREDSKAIMWQAAIIGACVAAVAVVGFIGYREYKRRG